MGLFDSILENKMFVNFAMGQMAKVFDSGKCEVVILRKDAETGNVLASTYAPGEVLYCGQDDIFKHFEQNIKLIVINGNDSNSGATKPAIEHPAQ
jgi:hypothetical protein